MNNGKLRYVAGVAVLATGIGLNAIWGWSNSRASDDDLNAVRVETAEIAARLAKHEREANQKFTKILVNQGSIGTSIDFLVSKQDPRRQPIAPAIEASSLAEEDE